MITVIDAMWAAAGRPDPDWTGKAATARPAPPSRPGVCAMTGARGEVWDARHVVSDSWTAWDLFGFRHVDPAGVGFGAAAAWALRTRRLFQRPHALVGASWVELDGPGLYDALVALDGHGTVLVPISRQKHVTPHARWGHVATDDGPIPWTAADNERLDVYRRLRAAGFGESALTEPAPRYQIIARADNPSEIMELWPALDGWRRSYGYMEVAARATRRPKDVEEADDAGSDRTDRSSSSRDRGR